jgi:hypothetical protein
MELHRAAWGLKATVFMELIATRQTLTSPLKKLSRFLLLDRLSLP